MKNLCYLIIPFVLFLLSCKKNSVEPQCIEDKIDTFKTGRVCDSGSSIKRYKFQGENVYVFGNGNCGADLASEVVDEECNSLGWLGGYTGNTKINGENFSNNSTFKETIWEN